MEIHYDLFFSVNIMATRESSKTLSHSTAFKMQDFDKALKRDVWYKTGGI